MDAIDVITEEVASNLEEAAIATRRLDGRFLGGFTGGLLVGLAAGGYIGYRLTKKKIRAEVLLEAEAEIKDAKEAYKRLYGGTSTGPAKPSIEQIVEDQGYSSLQGHTVTLDDGTRPTWGDITAKEEGSRPLPPPVPIRDVIHVAHPTIPDTPDTEKVDVEPKSLESGEWNYAYEQSRRKADTPYVIHEDEFRTGDRQYNQVTYTYYAADGVLSDDEDNSKVAWNIVGGTRNLRFGHGSEDPDVVFIRNDIIGIDIEVTQKDYSYESAVLGLDADDTA